MIYHIVATTKDLVIGYKNKMLWYNKEDLQMFKNLTKNNIVIMGRKTFESLNNKPLPDRINIVLTKNNLERDDIFIYNNIEDAINFSKNTYPDKDIFIIGGGEIYKSSYHLIDKILLSEIDKKIDNYDTVYLTHEILNKNFILDMFDIKNSFIFKVYSKATV